MEEIDIQNVCNSDDYVSSLATNSPKKAAPSFSIRYWLLNRTMGSADRHVS